MRWSLPIVAAAIGLAIFSPARAQDNSPEGRLREALRKETAERRALQDAQAGLQAQLDKAIQDRDAAVKALQAVKSQPPPKPTISDADLAKLRADRDALDTQNQALQANLAQLQTMLAQTTEIARGKTAEATQLGQRAMVAEAKLGICTTANSALIGVANDILHLYRTQDFRTLLIGSYEPLLGLQKVKLENLVQDYEDKIADHTYYGNEKLPAPPVPPATPAAAPPAAAAPAAAAPAGKPKAAR